MGPYGLPLLMVFVAVWMAFPDIFIDPRSFITPPVWAVGSFCAWAGFVMTCRKATKSDVRQAQWGVISAFIFLYYLQQDTTFQGWGDVYFFCGPSIQFCTCSMRWNTAGWMKAAAISNFVLSAMLGVQRFALQIGLRGLLPGEEQVTRDAFLSIAWRLLPYYLNNWEKQWGAESSSMLFEMPHYALELLVILPCVQVLCGRMRILAVPQVNILLRAVIEPEGEELPADTEPVDVDDILEDLPQAQIALLDPHLALPQPGNGEPHLQAAAAAAAEPQLANPNAPPVVPIAAAAPEPDAGRDQLAGQDGAGVALQPDLPGAAGQAGVGLRAAGQVPRAQEGAPAGVRAEGVLAGLGARGVPQNQKLYAPNMLNALWERDPRQQHLMGRLRAHTHVMIFSVLLCSLAFFNTLAVPIMLEEQVLAHSSAAPIIALGQHGSTSISGTYPPALFQTNLTAPFNNSTHPPFSRTQLGMQQPTLPDSTAGHGAHPQQGEGQDMCFDDDTCPSVAAAANDAQQAGEYESSRRGLASEVEQSDGDAEEDGPSWAPQEWLAHVFRLHMPARNETFEREEEEAAAAAALSSAAARPRPARRIYALLTWLWTHLPVAVQGLLPLDQVLAAWERVNPGVLIGYAIGWGKPAGPMPPPSLVNTTAVDDNSGVGAVGTGEAEADVIDAAGASGEREAEETEQRVPTTLPVWYDRLHSRVHAFSEGSCTEMAPLRASIIKHTIEVKRMKDPEHRSLLLLIESALAIMRLACERFFLLLTVYISFILFRDPPLPARMLIRINHTISYTFQRTILCGFPAICILFDAGFWFSLFVSVLFWGIPLVTFGQAVYKSSSRVQIRSLKPATPANVERMDGRCAICWGLMCCIEGDAANAATEHDGDGPTDTVESAAVVASEDATYESSADAAADATQTAPVSQTTAAAATAAAATASTAAVSAAAAAAGGSTAAGNSAAPPCHAAYVFSPAPAVSATRYSPFLPPSAYCAAAPLFPSTFVLPPVAAAAAATGMQGSAGTGSDVPPPGHSPSHASAFAQNLMPSHGPEPLTGQGLSRSASGGQPHAIAPSILGKRIAEHEATCSSTPSTNPPSNPPWPSNGHSHPPLSSPERGSPQPATAEGIITSQSLDHALVSSSSVHCLNSGMATQPGCSLAARSTNSSRYGRVSIPNRRAVIGPHTAAAAAGFPVGRSLVSVLVAGSHLHSHTLHTQPNLGSNMLDVQSVLSMTAAVVDPQPEPAHDAPLSVGVLASCHAVLNSQQQEQQQEQKQQLSNTTSADSSAASANAQQLQQLQERRERLLQQQQGLQQQQAGLQHQQADLLQQQAGLQQQRDILLQQNQDQLQQQRQGVAPLVAAAGAAAAVDADVPVQQAHGLGQAPAPPAPSAGNGSENGDAEEVLPGFALPCTHAYHAACLTQWLDQCRGQLRPPTCPMCADPIVVEVIWRFPWELFWKTLGWSGAATAGVGTGGLQAGGIHGGGAAGGMEGAPQQDAGGDIAWNLAGGAIDPRVGAAVDIVAAEMGMENAHVQVIGVLQFQREIQVLLRGLPAILPADDMALLQQLRDQQRRVVAIAVAQLNRRREIQQELRRAAEAHDAAVRATATPVTAPDPTLPPPGHENTTPVHTSPPQQASAPQPESTSNDSIQGCTSLEARIDAETQLQQQQLRKIRSDTPAGSIAGNLDSWELATSSMHAQSGEACGSGGVTASVQQPGLSMSTGSAPHALGMLAAAAPVGHLQAVAASGSLKRTSSMSTASCEASEALQQRPRQAGITAAAVVAAFGQQQASDRS